MLLLFSQGLRESKETDVFVILSKYCGLCLRLFRMRTEGVYLNRPLIHAQSHSLIPELNPTFGRDKDTVTV